MTDSEEDYEPRKPRKSRKPDLKRWCFTDFRVQVESLDPLVVSELPWDPTYKCFQYLTYGLEKCPSTGRWHYQGYIEFNVKVERKRVQRVLGDKIGEVSCRPCGGDVDANYDYCTKDFYKSWEFGTKLHMSQQGKRNDLIAVRNQLVTSSIPDMIESGVINNAQQLRLAESLQRYIPLSIQFEPKEVLWFHGPTGTGKTRSAAELIKSRSVQWFRCEPHCEWYDGYYGQEIAWFDDYRGSIPYNVLLQLTDGLQIRVKVKGSFVIWKPKTIIFTSTFHWSQVYQDPRDDIAQLARRITETREFS